MNEEIVELLKEIRDTLSSIDDQLYAIKIQNEDIRKEISATNGNMVESLTEMDSKLEDIATAIKGISL